MPKLIKKSDGKDVGFFEKICRILKRKRKRDKKRTLIGTLLKISAVATISIGGCHVSFADISVISFSHTTSQIDPEDFFDVSIQESDVEYDYSCKTCRRLVSPEGITYIDIPFQFKITLGGDVQLSDIDVYYRSKKYGELVSMSFSNPVLIDQEYGLIVNNSSKDKENPSVLPVVGFALSSTGGTQNIKETVRITHPSFERETLKGCTEKKECYLGVMHYYGKMDKKKFGYNLIEFSDTSSSKKKYRYIILHIGYNSEARYEIYKLDNFDVETLDSFLVKNKFNADEDKVSNFYNEISEDKEHIENK